ncbi:flagellar motor switch protein FliN [Desulfurispira natronophila]|uniref:Flagellar motor switch protein FliN n=1 Tax=Desulfurispira natronophila TaxID=682562 RepID=A0A7W7Y3N1_9BACT|nr:flagellar motor switch protein FliN [Desulfurispira natronophila]MBB5021428.1 flagellar motor switch protein FliN/FliY [Desulfurispira natronophila]
MTPEGLSQEEINAMLNMVGDDDSSDAPDLSAFAQVVAENFGTSMGTSINTTFEFSISQYGPKAMEELELPDTVVLSKVPFEEGATGTMFLTAAVDLASLLVDMMMMGAGESKEEMEDDDLEAFSDLVNTSISSCSVPLGEAAPGTKFRFGQPSSVAMDPDAVKSAIGDDAVYLIEFSANVTDKLESTMQLLIPVPLAQELAAAFSGGDDSSDDDDLFDFSDSDLEGLSADDDHEGASAADMESAGLSKDQLRNIDMLLDIDLAVIIRIGSTKIYLKDLLKLGSGSIVELDKKAGDPVELVINNKVIARGEVVVIDANFGLRINEILSKRDRLNSLRG